jgi:DNA-binding transcriptional LysR family regulator
MDRLTGLEVFTQVVECGGFSAAGRRLNMSVTMVSNHVQALEDRLGARLLNRTTRKISLTEVGRAYHARCIQILADLEQADAVAGELQSTPRGTLKLYMNSHIAQFIAPVVLDYLAAYPDAAIDFAVGQRPVDPVEDGYDLVIQTTQAPDSSLIARQLSRWRHILCATPDYLATHGAPETLADLTRRNCLRYTFYPFGDEWRFTGPDGAPASVRVSGNLVSSSGDLLRTAVLAGTGIIMAPGFLIADDVREGRVVPLLPQYRPLEFAILALYAHRHLLSAKVRVFLDMLAGRLGAYRHWLNPELP